MSKEIRNKIFNLAEGSSRRDRGASKPSSLEVSSESVTENKITWINGTGNITGTSIERSTDNITFSEIDTVLSPVEEYTDTVADNTMYYYRVRNYYGVLYSDYAVPVYAPLVDEPCLTTVSSAVISNNDDLGFYSEDGNDKAFWFSFWGVLPATGSHVLLNRNSEYQLGLNGRFYFYIYSGASTSVYLLKRTANTLQASVGGGWHHICGYYDGSKTAAGVKLYVDKVEVATLDSSVGTYDKMVDKETYSTQLSAGTGQLVDYKFGLGALTTQQISDLYDHLLIGNELVYYPMTEGHGSVIHNALDNTNPENHAYLAATTGVWANTQSIFKYNYYKGGTSIQDYFFPNNYISGKYFTPILGNIVAGQSNATKVGITSQLAGTDYENLLTAIKLDDTQIWIGSSAWKKMSAGNDFGTLFGIDSIVAENYLFDNRETFIVKLGMGSTGIYPGSSDPDWNPETVGELCDQLITDIQNSLLKMFEAGRDPYIHSFIWVQGERDGGELIWANAYYDNLVAFFDKIKLTTGDDLRTQITQLSIISADDTTNGKIIREAQDLFTSTYGNSFLIDTSDATFNDGTHYDAAYQINMGERQYNNIKDIVPAESESYLNMIYPDGFTRVYYSPRPQ